MNSDYRKLALSNRRQFLKTTSSGMAYLAFSAMANAQSQTPKIHFPAKAKRVIFLNMQGGPAAFETFVYKKGSTTMPGKRHGQSGIWVCDHFKELSKHADKLCLLNGMHCDSPVHPAAQIQLHCGLPTQSRPAMGAWVNYGLGSENNDLPGYIHLGVSSTLGGSKISSSAFLPSKYAGTPLDSNLTLSDFGHPRLSVDHQRLLLNRIQERNEFLSKRDPSNNHLDGIMESYEMSFRMQGSMPNLLDVDKENAKTKSLYGLNNKDSERFGRLCLAARRLSEAGVRFVEINHLNWDHHNGIADGIPKNCRETDKPIAGLLADLEQRGLLKETLIIWGGEFGRLPEKVSGHNPKGYTMWMAGAGVKAGYTHGDTDEQGIEAVEGKVHVHDLHATMLHILGLDHEKLTYSYAGRDWRLTDTKGKVVKEILS